MKYYDSIMELPIWNYDKVQKTGDFSFLMKEGKVAIDLDAIWLKIEEEVFNEFGLSSQYKEYIRKKLAAIKLYKEALVDGDKWKLALAKVKEAEAEAMQDGGMELGKLASMLSKFLGYRVDVRTTSVYSFMNDLKVAQDG